MFAPLQAMRRMIGEDRYDEWNDLSLGNLTQSASAPTPTTEHVVTLNGLDDATRYYYAVGSTGGIIAGDDAEHFFETHPPPGPATQTRIVVPRVSCWRSCGAVVSRS